MKSENWDAVHSAVEKRDSGALRRIARAASREQTRVLLNLLADMLDHDARNRRLPKIPVARARAIAARVSRRAS